MPGRVVGYIADIVDQFGSQFVDRNASALVPQRATSVQSIDNPQAENVIINDAVAFQGENAYVGTVAKVDDTERMLLEIGNQTDGNLSERAEAYRLVTVHELSGSEPALTDALSGEGTPDTEWVAPVGGDFVVFGTEQAVKDSIDIYRGIAAPHQLTFDGNKFLAQSTDGWVWFGEQDKKAALDDALDLPPTDETPAPVTLEVEFEEDGTWETSNIDFPPLKGLSIPATVRVDTPETFSGELSLEEGRWTVEGELLLRILSEGGDDLTLEVPLNATTGTSGQLEGSFERDGDTATATIVDNETPVNDQFGSTVTDALLGLDGTAGQSGTNWFSLTFELQGLPDPS